MEQIQKIIAVFDGILLRAAESLFSGTAALLAPFFITLATLLVAFIGLEMGVGLRAVRHEEIIQFLIRLVLIFFFALSWTNFEPLYTALTETTANLAINMFAIAKDNLQEPTAYAAMDQFGDKATEITDEVIKAQGSVTRGVIGGLLYIILGLMFAAYLLIVALAKIVVAILISVAPFAIIASMFEKTKSYFEEWLSSLIAYSLYPVAAAAIIATMTIAIDTVAIPEKGKGTIASILTLITLIFACKFAMIAIPFIATSITGKINMAPLAAAGMPPLRAAGVAIGFPARMLKERYQQVRSGWKNQGMTTQQVNERDRMGTKTQKNYAEMGRKMNEQFDRIQKFKDIGKKTPPKP